MSKKLVYDRTEGEEDIYAAWLANANERQVLEKILNKRFGEWCNPVGNNPFNIADIGCGRGSGALKMFRILDQRGIEYNYTGVEPSQIQLDQFRAQIGKDRNKTLICSKLEDFNPRKHFDLTFAVHPLYYVESMSEALSKMLALSDKTLIVHHGIRGINEVHQRFRKYVKKGPNIISTHEDVARALEELGVRYSLEVYPTKTNISSCKDSTSKKGRSLIKFFLEQPRLSEKVIREVSGYFAAMKSDYLTHDLGLIITK